MIVIPFSTFWNTYWFIFTGLWWLSENIWSWTIPANSYPASSSNWTYLRQMCQKLWYRSQKVPPPFTKSPYHRGNYLEIHFRLIIFITSKFESLFLWKLFVGLSQIEFNVGYTIQITALIFLPSLFSLIFLTKCVVLYALSRPRSNSDTI